MTTTPQSDGPPSAAQDVAKLGPFRPPLVYLVSLVTGVLIQRAAPLPFVPGTLAVPLGASLVVVAKALFAYSVAKFRAAGTPVPAPKANHRDCPDGPLSLQPQPDLSGVLIVPTRHRDLDQQPVAPGHARGGGGSHPLRRHTERGAVPGTKIRCPVLGLQDLRAPLVVSHPTSGWSGPAHEGQVTKPHTVVRRPLSRALWTQG
jgi:hypothetical protein